MVQRFLMEHALTDLFATSSTFPGQDKVDDQI